MNKKSYWNLRRLQLSKELVIAEFAGNFRKMKKLEVLLIEASRMHQYEKYKEIQELKKNDLLL